MAINALSTHSVLITRLVLLAGRPQQLNSIRALQTFKQKIICNQVASELSVKIHLH